MDFLTPAQRSERMSRIRGSGTKPELILAKELRQIGMRFRQQAKGIAGKPDFANKSKRVAIFVNGCFWHGHLCQKGRIPKTNSSFWAEKILANRKRDRRNARYLRVSGWIVITVWECRIKKKTLLEKEILRIRRELDKRFDPLN